MGGNKFKANTVLAIKLARAVYFMLKNKTVFEPERLVLTLRKATKLLALAAGNPHRLTGCDKTAMPPPVTEPTRCANSAQLCVGQASNPAH